MDPDFKIADEKIKKACVAIAAISGCNFLLGSNNSTYIHLAILTLSVFSLSGYKRRRYLRMLWRDVRCFVRLIHIAKSLKDMQKNEMTIPKKFKETVLSNPDKVMFYLEDEAWTFKMVDEFSNKVAHYFRSQGFKGGDTVALIMETRTEYVGLWLGLLKIGVTVSLINYNLTGNPLSHSLRAVPIKAIIYGPEVAKALREVSSSFTEVLYYKFNLTSEVESVGSAVDLEEQLSHMTTLPPPTPETNFRSIAFYIFTSGTTGMPKAAIITHGRYISMATSTFIYTKMRSDDTLYVSLPLYHTNGCILGVGQAVVSGLTVALRKKFSVTNFWKDCIKYNCTIFIYIGELCRYLLAAPPQPEDTRHHVRLILGNGLRPLVWNKFVRRFHIQQVAEFYGSSEGIGVLMNTEGKVGAVGHIPLLWPSIVPIHLVKFDTDNEMPMRNAKGRCIEITEPGVPGMHISKIIKNRVGQEFEGYTEGSATKKKIIHGVFQAGDQYYVSGDVFTMDEEKFIYFQDRTGDTFRWRGENVSTTEVEQVISDILDLRDAVVYGVEIPGNEGKAGMAALSQEQEGNHNLNQLNKQLSKRLPKYARPLFLRFLPNIQITETYKLKKRQLREDGYNPHIVKDKLYFFNSKEKKYTELTKEIYNLIERGDLSF